MLKRLVTVQEFVKISSVLNPSNVNLSLDVDKALSNFQNINDIDKQTIKLQQYLDQAGMQVNSFSNNQIYNMWDYLNTIIENGVTDKVSSIDLKEYKYNIDSVKYVIIKWVEVFIQTHQIFADTTVEAPSNLPFTIEGKSDNANIEITRLDLINILNTTFFFNKVYASGSVVDNNYNWFTDNNQYEDLELGALDNPNYKFKNGYIVKDVDYLGLQNQTSIETLTTKIGELQDWVNSNTLLDKEQADLIKNNLTQIQTNTQNIANNSNQITTQQQTITQIQQVNTNQDNSISSLNSLTTTHSNDITTLNNGLDTANNRIANNATNTQQNTTQIQSLLETINQQKALIKELQNDLIALEKVLKTANIIVYRGHYDSSISYRLGDTVTNSENNPILYLSLQDSNLGNSLDNKEYWLPIGSTSTVDLSNYFTKQQILNLFTTNLANYANLHQSNTFIQPISVPNLTIYGNSMSDQISLTYYNNGLNIGSFSSTPSITFNTTHKVVFDKDLSNYANVDKDNYFSKPNVFNCMSDTVGLSVMNSSIAVVGDATTTHAIYIYNPTNSTRIHLDTAIDSNDPSLQLPTLQTDAREIYVNTASSDNDVVYHHSSPNVANLNLPLSSLTFQAQLTNMGERKKLYTLDLSNQGLFNSKNYSDPHNFVISVGYANTDGYWVCTSWNINVRDNKLEIWIWRPDTGNDWNPQGSVNITYLN